MHAFKKHYEALDPALCLLFVAQQSKGKLFWKNQEIDYRVQLKVIFRHSSPDSITAIFIMMREVLYCQNTELFIVIIDFINAMNIKNIPSCLDITKLKKYVT